MLKTNAFVLTSFFLVSLPVFASAQSGAHQHSAQGAWQLTLRPEAARPKICLADPQVTSSFKRGTRQGGHGVSQQQPAYPDEIACQNAVEAGRAGLAMSDNMMYIKQAENHAYSSVPLYQVVGARVDSVKMAQLSPDSQTMALVFQHQGQSQLNFVHTKSMRPQYKPVTLKVGLQNPKAFIFSKSQPAFANGSTVALQQQPSNLGVLVGESRMARVVAAGDNLHIVDSPAAQTGAITSRFGQGKIVARTRPSKVHLKQRARATTSSTAAMINVGQGVETEAVSGVLEGAAAPKGSVVSSHPNQQDGWGEQSVMIPVFFDNGRPAGDEQYEVYTKRKPMVLRRPPGREAYSGGVYSTATQDLSVGQGVGRQ
jgi:hypothetical protein